MATSRCPSLDCASKKASNQSPFALESVTVTPKGSQFPVELIQCSVCGTGIGVVPATFIKTLADNASKAAKGEVAKVDQTVRECLREVVKLVEEIYHSLEVLEKSTLNNKP